MKIVQVKESDINEHAALLVEVFKQEPWCESWEIENAHDRLQCYKKAPYFLGLSAIEKGELIGFLFGNFEPYQKASQFIIKEMCVKTIKQRSGVGKKLLTELNNLLESSNASASCLLTRKGSPAESFYLNSGYLLSESMGLYFNEIQT
jgi:aminoglycoside 6'-N-acetyltransferase I